MASEIGMPDPFDEVSSSPLPPPPPQRKMWFELRQAIRKTRKLALSLANRVPHSFSFRHVHTSSGVHTRIYFLGVLPHLGNRENTLLYVDVPVDQQLDSLEWQQLLVSLPLTHTQGQFSKEEQLLRERKRLGSFGITSYDFHESSGRFVFPASSSLYHCADQLLDGDFTNQWNTASEVVSRSINTRLDPKISPSDPDLLAFICANDIWVTNIATKEERRLTYANKGSKRLADDPLSAGVPSFVVQEEFDRYTGYWWQPSPASGTSKAPSKGGGFKHRILYEEVDESDVEIIHLSCPSSMEKDMDEYRYPRAGTPNARCTLKMLEFEVDGSGNIIDKEIVTKELFEPLSVLFPWMEYIPRAGWTPDGQYVYVTLLDRPQRRMEIVLIPYQSFVSSSPPHLPHSHDPSFHYQVIYKDVSTIWINVNDTLHFFPQGNRNTISFLTTSEKSGFRHLYYVTSQLPSRAPHVAGTYHDKMDSNTDPSQPLIFSEVAITNGDWEVIGKQLWVDEKHGLVYFMGLMDTPLETHLYVASLTKNSPITRLTEPGYSHAVSFDKECSLFVSVYSSINNPPASHIYRIIRDDHNHVSTHIISALLQPTPLSEDYHPPELFSYESECGYTMCGMFYRPHNIVPGKKYPTVMFVYGGPQIQLVTNAYKSIKFLRLHTLASLGYAVVMIDTRGSCHRGLGFEAHLQSRLGQVEIDDQVEGLHWLASQVDFIDLERVAIHGWSYGGYLALMGLRQRPEVFKVAIAGAPVTSWALYDTGYTERYMDTPERNPDGYKAGSVTEQAHNFPSEGNRLLIVHGLIDENVHFFHTSILINALIKACKPHQLQLYPNERHGIRNPEASEHYETMMLNFLQQNL